VLRVAYISGNDDGCDGLDNEGYFITMAWVEKDKSMLNWVFDKDTRIVRIQLKNGCPPEIQKAFEELCSLGFPKWRIWMILTSAYKATKRMCFQINKVFDDAVYRKLLETAGNSPDGFTVEDALEIKNNQVSD
jgi:hypothetical protein